MPAIVVTPGIRRRLTEDSFESRGDIYKFVVCFFFLSMMPYGTLPNVSDGFQRKKRKERRRRRKEKANNLFFF